MTATPIPRTLAQTRYADLDLSIIDELPPGRTPIATFVDSREPQSRASTSSCARTSGAASKPTSSRRRSRRRVESALTRAPSPKPSASRGEDLRRAARRRAPRPDAAARERARSWGAFTRGEIDVLIATTVVEVGVDVPNASVMVVLDAHRYGLAQLHQLRGASAAGSRGRSASWSPPTTRLRLGASRSHRDRGRLQDRGRRPASATGRRYGWNRTGRRRERNDREHRARFLTVHGGQA